MNRQSLKLINDNIDNPKMVYKLFKIQLNNNKSLREECLLRNEIIKLHEKDENNEVKHLICESILNDIISDVQIQSLENKILLMTRKYKKQKLINKEIEELKKKYEDLNNMTKGLKNQNDYLRNELQSSTK
tara:strand:+ start:160 stop:552 length:393 start_codon:yes stop_codon:yes gene_type:complete